MTKNGSDIRFEADIDELLGQIVEEFTDKLSRGETIDIGAYEQEFPNHIEEIKSLLPTLKTMVRLGRSPGSDKTDSENTESELSHGKQLGDFIIFDEIGRGGMGVVYEAEQVSMNRRVALKVLPFAAILDEKAITRFKNEARAAGTLEHPNIVPVYAVGKDRGVYYYAMSLINGLTMAEIIAQLRNRLPTTDPRLSIDSIVSDSRSAATAARIDPTTDFNHGDEAQVEHSSTTKPVLQADLSTFASTLGSAFFTQVATLGVQAARALDFAHEHGIIHRDVKPGNLMVDGEGKLWVTDFGLARIESDAGMTATGDFLGTVRYTAPEQALARKAVVDHRADVYSLGATLYEMLTLRPVFDGNSRDELLRQLTFEEPRRLRDFNPAIPADLETIVLKATAMDSADRYASAAELAEDLQRHLDHRPIKARPATLSQRLTKFTRRHPAWFLSASVFAVLCLIVVSIYSVRLSAAFESAIVEKRIADENFALAVSTVERFSNTIQQETDSDFALRKKLLEHSLEYFTVFVSKRRNDEQLKVQLAEAYWNIGQIQRELGQWEASRKAHSKALAIRRQLVRDDPENPERLANLAESCARSGDVMTTGSEPQKRKEVEELTAESVRLSERLSRRWPSARHSDLYAENLGRLGDAFVRSSNQKAADEAYRKAITELQAATKQHGQHPERTRTLAKILRRVAGQHRNRREPQKAIKVLNESLDLYRKLDPKERDNYRGYAANHRAMGNLYTYHLKNLGKGREHYEKALQIGLDQKSHRPALVWPRSGIASTYRALAANYQIAGKRNDAISYYRKSIDELKAIVLLGSDYRGWGFRLAGTYRDLAKALRDNEANGEAIAAFKSSVAEWKQLIRKYPDDSEYERNGGVTLLDLAKLYLATGRTDDAKRAAWESIDALSKIAGRSSSGRSDQQRVIAAYELLLQIDSKNPVTMSRLAWILVTNRHPDAWDSKRAALLAQRAIDQRDEQAFYWYTLGVAHYRARDWSRAAEAFSQATKRRNKNSMGFAGFFIAMNEWRLGHKAAASRTYQEAVTWMTKENPKDADLIRFRREAVDLLGTSPIDR